MNSEKIVATMSDKRNTVLLRSIFHILLQVRIKAQHALVHCLDTYLYSGRSLLPDVLPLLSSDNGVSHEQFKVPPLVVGS